MPATPAMDPSASFAARHEAAAPCLAPFVSGYTDYREHTGVLTRREMPSLQSVLIVNLGAPIRVTAGDGRLLSLGPGEGFVAGLHDRHALSHSDGSQAGVHVWLTARGAEHLLGGAAGTLANQGVKLTDIFGAGGAALGGRLVDAPNAAGRFAALDAALGAWMAKGQAARPQVAWAFRQLRRNPAYPVTVLAAEIGCSRKTLTAQFRAQYGIAPKTAARLARFERVIAACGGGAPDWAGIAQQAGYFDQPHMIRDFTGFAGLTPSQYAARLTQGAGVIEPEG